MVRTLSPERRAALLSAALKLFVEQGVQNTSTAQISREAGIAAGTLFLYFATKQELIDALALQISQEQAEAVQMLLTPDLSAQETFAAIWHSSVGWFSRHLDAYLYIQQVRDAGVLSPKVVEVSNRHFGYYYTAIQKGLQEGAIQPYPLELIGGILYQCVVAVMNLIRAHPEQQEQYVQAGFQIFWDGIRTQSE